MAAFDYQRVLFGVKTWLVSHMVWLPWQPHEISGFFPECVARVPVSLWGCGGRAVFAGRCVYVRNRSQPFVTVRNRPREGRMAVRI